MKLKIREIIPSVSYANIKDTGFKYPNILLKEFAKYVTLWYSPTKHAVATLIGIPTITSIDTPSGGINGNTDIIITGTNLKYIIDITFGGIPAFIFGEIDDTHCLAITPPGSAGTVILKIITESGSATTTYTYV
jgi:hypothetical protein